MAFYSGNGGTTTIGVVVLVNKSFTITPRSRTTENTNSGSAGSTNYEHVVFDHSWTIDGPWDDVNLPDTDAGLIPGNKVTITFKCGASSKVYILTNTMVETMEVINDNSGDIVRFRASGKGGALTFPIT